jgi:hypothetical protein
LTDIKKDKRKKYWYLFNIMLYFYIYRPLKVKDKLSPFEK